MNPEADADLAVGQILAHTLEGQQESLGSGRWRQPATRDAQFLRIFSDPRGLEVAMDSMADDDLAAVLNALYRNLDTYAPELYAILGHEKGAEFSLAGLLYSLPPTPATIIVRSA